MNLTLTKLAGDLRTRAWFRRAKTAANKRRRENPQTDWIGQKRDMLTILAVNGTCPHGNRQRPTFLCRCDCGREVTKTYWALRKPNEAKDCGCRRAERNTTHGLTKTLEHRRWISMHDRCRNPNHRRYNVYGGRGIRVCERWGSFENFLSDMGPCPPGGTLDRIDVNGNYEPGNCRWISNKEQQNNRRDNLIVEFRGERMTLKQLSERTGVSWSKLRHRIFAMGLSPEVAVSAPPLRGKTRGRNR